MCLCVCRSVSQVLAAVARQKRNKKKTEEKNRQIIDGEANISLLIRDRKFNPYANQTVYQFNYETNRWNILNVVRVLIFERCGGGNGVWVVHE